MMGDEARIEYTKCDRCGSDLSCAGNVFVGFTIGGKTWDCLCLACITTLFSQEDAPKEVS